MACLAMNNTPGAILAALLAFDTTSRHSNMAMIDWIADFLAARGVASRRFYDPSGG
ncbi:TPA: acetylornithine deacetylase, partial [Klebsiella quasipneumoniae]|nr:acetylornithine deacetylase [Klebsiella quasipneumoniae]